MGQSAEELRRDIERTREELGGTIDAIGDRVSPSRVMERRTNRMKDGITSVRTRVMGSAEDRWSSLAEGVHTTGSDTGGRMSDVGHGLADRASDVGDTVRGAPDTVRTQAQGNPLMAGVVAFGLGAVIGAAFPGSKVEGQLAQTAMAKAEPLKEEAQQIGQQLSSSLQESGQQAAEHVKETATQGAEQVKQTAQQHAEHTAEVGAEAADKVKGDATSTAQQVKDDTAGTAQQIKDS